jgi:hypothetical protein
MARKSRIEPTIIARTERRRIQETRVPVEPEVSFNFKQLHRKKGKFDYLSCDSRYFQKLLERLKALSRMTKSDLVYSHSKALRFHRIDFRDGKVTEKTFGLADDVDDDAWQFQITKTRHGRVHGYFVESIFYLVWLDPKHELYH